MISDSIWKQYFATPKVFLQLTTRFLKLWEGCWKSSRGQPKLALCTWKKHKENHTILFFCKIFETPLLLLILGGTEGNCHNVTIVTCFHFSTIDGAGFWGPSDCQWFFKKKLGGEKKLECCDFLYYYYFGGKPKC